MHGRTPAVAARMPPAVLLVINLRIRAAADCCCGSSSSLLLPDSVKPAVQRGVQNSRGFVPPEAERIRAHRPELDGTPRLTETRGTGHGRTTEREVASERQNNEKNTDLTRCPKTSDLAHPGLDLVMRVRVLSFLAFFVFSVFFLSMAPLNFHFSWPFVL